MNKSIVKLHNKEDNSVILVDFNNVPVVDTVEIDERNCSMIYFEVYRDDMDHYFEVNETPDKIFAAYPELAKSFLKLHNSDTNLVTYINIEFVNIIDTVRCEERKCCSKIYLSENAIDAFVVNETPERIYTMIEEYYKTVPNNG